ncbi:hypothetical protein CY34DRAFT_811892 [Suillus luteus UH-Slu-Lm8-n1]|uniref:Glutathione S-transferase UstS-like C-terminal domain-containing protein n=1 Tax=Suillus luteus UH-Slu-Lm8-n1 TaxID=930992 RepID=A0A0C9ZE52_9AGAM|nr:hypothetical protein CY34DRAFT_811892 [Suillus luteus UH-Slu-Lm8-n1]
MKSIGAKTVKAQMSILSRSSATPTPEPSSLTPSKSPPTSKRHPEKAIFPNNSEPFIRELNSTFASLLLPAIKPLFARTAELLSPVSGKFFTEARSVYVPLPWGVGHDEDWDPLEKMYNTVYEWYQKTDGKWIMGDTFSYADITVASSLLWYKRVAKEDGWARISSWNGEKWAQLLADVEQECNLA